MRFVAQLWRWWKEPQASAPDAPFPRSQDFDFWRPPLKKSPRARRGLREPALDKLDTIQRRQFLGERTHRKIKSTTEADTMQHDTVCVVYDHRRCV